MRNFNAQEWVCELCEMCNGAFDLRCSFCLSVVSSNSLDHAPIISTNTMPFANNEDGFNVKSIDITVCLPCAAPAVVTPCAGADDVQFLFIRKRTREQDTTSRQGMAKSYGTDSAAAIGQSDPQYGSIAVEQSNLSDIAVGWPCTYCTFHNNSRCAVCAVCENDRIV